MYGEYVQVSYRDFRSSEGPVVVLLYSLRCCLVVYIFHIYTIDGWQLLCQLIYQVLKDVSKKWSRTNSNHTNVRHNEAVKMPEFTAEK